MMLYRTTLSITFCSAGFKTDLAVLHNRKHAWLQVSAVIRGPPGDVLRALLDPGSATTILGPALEVEVLESTPGRQVRGSNGAFLPCPWMVVFSKSHNLGNLQ